MNDMKWAGSRAFKTYLTYFLFAFNYYTFTASERLLDNCLHGSHEWKSELIHRITITISRFFIVLLDVLKRSKESQPVVSVFWLWFDFQIKKTSCTKIF